MQVLNAVYPMLERGKKHILACLSLLCLISKATYQIQGQWYVRLVMNLRHLKMKTDAFELIDKVLAQGVVVRIYERNSLLKMRLALFGEICRSELKGCKIKKRPGRKAVVKKSVKTSKRQVERRKRITNVDSFLDTDGGALDDFNTDIVMSEPSESSEEES